MLSRPVRVASAAKAVVAVFFSVVVGIAGFHVVRPYLGKADSNKARKPAFKVGIEVGNKAPEIEGKDLEGRQFKLSDYHGKVVMLDFWGNW
jgi:hypothetical protein